MTLSPNDVCEHAMNATELLHHAASDMAAAVREGFVTATALGHASLERISVTQARVNAFTDVTAKRALQPAADLDTRLATGDTTVQELPSLGVPFAVKNLFDVVGLTTLAGSKIERGKPAAVADAPLVARLQAAGAVLVSALNMDEYAYGFTTENTHEGSSHNPHDLARIAGGSSGGSAAAVAAVAAGQVPISLGSDTNGSIRAPATPCVAPVIGTEWLHIHGKNCLYAPAWAC
jgi:1-carboxybiuret hydrolase